MTENEARAILEARRGTFKGDALLMISQAAHDGQNELAQWVISCTDHDIKLCWWLACAVLQLPEAVRTAARMN